MKIMNKLEKWVPIFESLGINKEYFERISYHIERIAEKEYKISISVSETIESLISLELKVISKINDLSKIIFVENSSVDINTDPNSSQKIISINDNRFKINISYEEIMFEINKSYRKELFENIIISEISNHINKLIDEGNNIYVLNFVSSIVTITEKTMSPHVFVISKFKSIKQ
jgi:hypothetical protein